MKNITYFLGAGACYYACPIWREQGEKMEQLNNFLNDRTINATVLNQAKECIQIIAEIGGYAKKFNTVDTYAKMLYLNNENEKLALLKKAVNLFFTLWLSNRNTDWKKLFDNGKSDTRIYDIDPRYINLLAYYLEKGTSNPQLNSKIKFITWNYDLQIESAYLKFCQNINHYSEINQFLPFIPDESKEVDLSICHLNGFHGFVGKLETNCIQDKLLGTDKIDSLLHRISETTNVEKDAYSYENYINYAWEENNLVKNVRDQARKIMNDTNVLIIIGYSFPPFNHDIDKQLLESMKNCDKIIFQDPSATIEKLTESFDLKIDKRKIKIVNSNMEQFIIPNWKEEKFVDSSSYFF